MQVEHPQCSDRLNDFRLEKLFVGLGFRSFPLFSLQFHKRADDEAAIEEEFLLADRLFHKAGREQKMDGIILGAVRNFSVGLGHLDLTHYSKPRRKP